MAVLDILKFPDPRLRRKCTPIEKITEEWTQFADDMLETMYFHHGLGLSAIQVNRFVRILTADIRPLYKNASEETNERYDTVEPGQYEQSIEQPVVLFNPEITKQSGKVTFKEGCLSFPSYYAAVKRAELIEVTALDRTGKTINIKTDGVLSICIQHEIDHLNGKLFIDHLSPVKAERLRAQIKKYGYPSQEGKQDRTSVKETS